MANRFPLPALQVLAVGAVVTVHVLPIVVSKDQGIIDHAGGLMLGLATALIIMIVAALPTSIGWALAGLRRQWSVTPIPLLIFFLCPVLSTLPGMVHAHRALFGWHGYGRNMLPSVLITVASVVGFSTAAVHQSITVARSIPAHVPWRTAGVGDQARLTREAFDPNRGAKVCLCVSLIVASATNLFFPWWPLD